MYCLELLYRRRPECLKCVVFVSITRTDGCRRLSVSVSVYISVRWDTRKLSSLLCWKDSRREVKKVPPVDVNSL